MADFNHVDYTDELNRIIVALSDIRDYIKLIRRLGENNDMGVVVTSVMNDFERAALAATMGNAGGGDGEAIRRGVANGDTAVGGNSGPNETVGDDVVGDEGERADTLTSLAQDPEDDRVLLRIDGIYYWEVAPTVVDDGLREPYEQTTQVAKGEQIGYHDLGSNKPKPGAPPSADVINVQAPRRRWPKPRDAANPTTGINTTGNLDLVNPVTGEVRGKDAALIAAESTASGGRDAEPAFTLSDVTSIAPGNPGNDGSPPADSGDDTFDLSDVQ